jgi:hypothetical protein
MVADKKKDYRMSLFVVVSLRLYCFVCVASFCGVQYCNLQGNLRSSEWFRQFGFRVQYCTVLRAQFYITVALHVSNKKYGVV